MTESECVASCVNAVADLTLLFVGQPEDRTMTALSQTCKNIEAELVQTFGADGAAKIAAAFVDAVIGRRAELELLTIRGG